MTITPGVKLSIAWPRDLDGYYPTGNYLKGIPFS